MKSDFLNSGCTAALLLFVHESVAASSSSIRACRPRSVTSVIIYESLVHISTNVASNTSFAINTDFTVTVSNAPTDLDTTATHTSRTTFLSAISVSATSTPYPVPASVTPLPSTISDGTPFVLSIRGFNSGIPLRKRQSFNYIGPQGRMTSNCSSAMSYVLANGQLILVNGSTTLQFTATSGQSYAPFSPSANPGSITTVFALGQGGALMWMNSAFPNGNALFCMQPDSTVFAVFVSGSQPAGCTFITLMVSDLTGCIEGLQGPQGE